MLPLPSCFTAACPQPAARVALPMPQGGMPLPCPSPPGARFLLTLWPSPTSATSLVHPLHSLPTHSALPTLPHMPASLSSFGSWSEHQFLGECCPDHTAAPKTSYPSVDTVPCKSPLPVCSTYLEHKLHVSEIICFISFSITLLTLIVTQTILVIWMN